jgi:hypothetical protein
MAECRHIYQVSCWVIPAAIKIAKKNRPPISHRCKKCGKTFERPMTDDEIIKYRNRWLEEKKEIKQTHKLWHKFAKKFGSEGNWKYKGYDFMEAVDKFAEKNPEVVVTSCDDSYFAGSSIVLIPHKGFEKYMGTTIIIIPQLSGCEPCQMFLYPNHADQLIEALKCVPLGKQPDWDMLRRKNLNRLKKGTR